MYESQNNSIPPTSLSPPYSKYWTRYKTLCPNKTNSYFQLNMKRKALTLQYNNSNYTKLKNTTLYIKAVKNQNRIANRYSNGLINTANCKRDLSFSASKSNVPGNKGFILYDDPNVAIYNYVPETKIYQGGNNKYPYTAWKYGMLGFPNGMKGTSREMRRAAQIELSNNRIKYSRAYSNTCFNTICSNKTIMDISVVFNYHNKMSDSKFNINKTINLYDITNQSKINIYTSGNTLLYPILLNPTYTNIRDKGNIWCSHLNNNKYIYFLTNKNNNWWYSISKLSKTSEESITSYINTKYKTLAYAIYTPYPFIEFKLTNILKSNKYYEFTVDEIYFQTKKLTSNHKIYETVLPGINNDYNYVSNKNLLSSATKLYFTVTNDEWKHKHNYKPIYIQNGDITNITNNIDISKSQCIATANINPCRPCNAMESNCRTAINTIEKKYYTCVLSANSYTDERNCPSNGVFSALTNTFWWRTNENDSLNLFNYDTINKFNDISHNLDISASFNYDDFITSQKKLLFKIQCRE